MPSHRDPHQSHLDDYLALAALGETVPTDVAAHQQHCASCQSELNTLRHVADLAHEAAQHRDHLDAVPPASIWDGIAAELDLPVTATGTSSERGRVRRRLIRLPRTLIAAVAALLLAGTALGGYLIGERHSAVSATAAVSPARLNQFPGGPRDVTGTASVHTTAAGIQLSMTTAGLPLRAGYYEVWLYDPVANNMVAIGALGQGGSGTYTLPSQIDLSAYDTVDVSAQDYTGGSIITHAQSVLRGRFTQ